MQGQLETTGRCRRLCEGCNITLQVSMGKGCNRSLRAPPEQPANLMLSRKADATACGTGIRDGCAHNCLARANEACCACMSHAACTHPQSSPASLTLLRKADATATGSIMRIRAARLEVALVPRTRDMSLSSPMFASPRENESNACSRGKQLVDARPCPQGGIHVLVALMMSVALLTQCLKLCNALVVTIQNSTEQTGRTKHGQRWQMFVSYE